MLGAIIGDIVGSHYEVLEVEALKNNPDKKRTYKNRISILNPQTPLFTESCSYTDDSVLTIAIANAILTDFDYEKSLRLFGLQELNLGLDKYGRSRFSKGFISWLKGENKGLSIGNGAAMRISPVSMYFSEDLEQSLIETKKATIPSHNTDEALTAAELVSTTIFYVREGFPKEKIKKELETLFNINLSFNLQHLQHNYRFHSEAMQSVPEAIYCFLISHSFEETIRNAISIGGDSDTIAAIAGSIAENYYGIPEDLKEKAMSYLPSVYKSIVDNFYHELNIRHALKEVGIDCQYFIEYMRTHTKIIAGQTTDDLWGFFVKEDEHGIIKEIRIVVPKIVDEHTMAVNIHEYTHAYEYFKHLGSVYSGNTEESERIARENEIKYLKKKNN